uniref:Melanoregulin n=1 Tax=Takifugu rubripes TaxID=31033 RepID=H2RSK8_TAKRU
MVPCIRFLPSVPSRQHEVAPNDSSDSDTNGESFLGPQRSAGPRVLQDKGMLERPTREGLDRELQTFISMRDQTDQATEEWEKLNYDIHTLRYARREVRSRWKKILLQLGYQCEVDALLCVSSQSQFSHEEEHLTKAAELLEQLLDHTSLFPAETGHQSRYLCVMERLVSLDSAEEFVRLAQKKYPKKG